MGFGVCFKTLDLQKRVFEVCKMLFCFGLISCQILFWINFRMILGAFRRHFGSQYRGTMRSQINQKMMDFFDRSWTGSGAPQEFRATLTLTFQGPRGTGIGMEGGESVPRGWQH